MATWCRFGPYTPKTTGMHRVAVHPNGTIYYAIWLGRDWSTPCLSEAAAVTMAKLSKGRAFKPTTDLWYQPLERKMSYVPSHSYTTRSAAPKSQCRTPVSQEASPVSKHPLTRYAVTMPACYFPHTRADAKAAAKAVVADATPVRRQRQRKARQPKVEWYAIEEYVPSERGAYRVWTSAGEDTEARWTGTRFRGCTVTHWAAL